MHINNQTDLAITSYNKKTNMHLFKLNNKSYKKTGEGIGNINQLPTQIGI